MFPAVDLRAVVPIRSPASGTIRFVEAPAEGDYLIFSDTPAWVSLGQNPDADGVPVVAGIPLRVTLLGGQSVFIEGASSAARIAMARVAVPRCVCGG